MGMTQVQRDINTYYILGYYSTNDAMDGKYRRVKVVLNGNQQAKLDFRNGYYAGKVWAKFNSTDKERQLQEALALGDPAYRPRRSLSKSITSAPPKASTSSPSLRRFPAPPSSLRKRVRTTSLSSTSSDRSAIPKAR